MDVRTFKELCQRLDELAAILQNMECDPINADLHREASDALSQALSEIERLRSDADQHRETSNALRLLRLNGFGRTLPTYTTPSSI